MLLGLLLLSALSHVGAEFGSDGRVLSAVSLPALGWGVLAKSGGGSGTDLFESRVDQLVLRIEVTSHARSGFGVMEVERLWDGGAHMLLSLQLLQILNKLLLQALEIRNRLSLGGHKCENVLRRISLGLVIDGATGLCLQLLLVLVLLHARWQLRQR